jgi:cyanophycinase
MKYSECMYRQRSRLCFTLFLGLLPATLAQAQAAPTYRYIRVGNALNIATIAQPGYALMGGGADLDEAFQWLCARADGGDLLVLRATGDDEYNAYIAKLCQAGTGGHLNSVATLIIPDRAAAADPFVEKTIAHAAAIFIAGGDQANYINFWQGTPVQSALNSAIQRGAPIGGTSAGLAVLSEYAYTAQGDKPDDPNLDGKTAIADPFGPRITLSHNFLEIPILKGIITDSHFARRNRMGRLLVFLARLNEQDGKPVPLAMNIRGIGVEQGAAVLVEPSGKAIVIGKGSAYFVDALHASGMMIGGKFGVMALHKPLTFGPYGVKKVPPGHNFDLKSWTGNRTGDSVDYQLSIDAGSIHSTQPGGAIY